MKIQTLSVLYCEEGEPQVVGKLAANGHEIFFEYDAAFLQHPHWLSPFKLAPRSGLIAHQDHQFGPIFGLFDDSLPDGWGLRMMDQWFYQNGIPPHTVSVLDRLAYLGSRTMGALCYQPHLQNRPAEQPFFELLHTAQQVEQVLSGSTKEVLPQLILLGASPGGARPKVLIGLKQEHLISGVENLPPDYEPWILKFHARKDSIEEGLVEEAYARMARQAGLDVPPTGIFTEPTTQKHYFGIQRFDRQGNHRIHSHTFGNLIHSNFRIPSCDYDLLFRVTFALTKRIQDVEQRFRQMVFNVFTHNRDDHVKNFSFLYHNRGWFNSPCYDLTFAHGPGGEHSMTILGEGREPEKHHMIELGRKHNLSQKRMQAIFEEVEEACVQWEEIAKDVGISKRMRIHISKYLP